VTSRCCVTFTETLSVWTTGFYPAMHFSAKRDIELHVVCPPVCLSVCDVGGSESHRLEILETNYTENYTHLYFAKRQQKKTIKAKNKKNPNTFALRSPKAIHLLPGEHGQILGD